jgi:cupin 2 domain-containing protein
MAEVRRGTVGSAGVPAHGERFVDLAHLPGAVVEEIVSSSRPNTGLQVQDHDEWVVLLEGGAQLDVDGELVTLAPHDWLLLPARTPHRVLRTDPGSRWLAVHARP